MDLTVWSTDKSRQCPLKKYYYDPCVSPIQIQEFTVRHPLVTSCDLEIKLESCWNVYNTTNIRVGVADTASKMFSTENFHFA